MKHLEQIKELVTSEIGRFAITGDYIPVETTQSYEEYQVSFLKEFNPIYIRAYSDGNIHVRVGDFYESVSTIDSTCCYLYVALMNAKRELD